MYCHHHSCLQHDSMCYICGVGSSVHVVPVCGTVDWIALECNNRTCCCVCTGIILYILYNCMVSGHLHSMLEWLCLAAPLSWLAVVNWPSAGGHSRTEVCMPWALSIWAGHNHIIVVILAHVMIISAPVVQCAINMFILAKQVEPAQKWCNM